jgi:2'-5' RNA ligase
MGRKKVGSETGPEDTAGRGRPVRIFIGVKLADEIARALNSIAQEINGHGVRIVASSDLHLTLVPPWQETSPSDAFAKMQRAVTGCNVLALTVQHVGYGPDPKRPRCLWADCVPSAELAALRVALLAAFAQTQPDDRPFRPHITLARIRHGGRAVMRKHPIDRPLSFTVPVESVVLFQSPGTGEGGYRVLGSARLGGTSSAVSGRPPDALQ